MTSMNEVVIYQFLWPDYEGIVFFVSGAAGKCVILRRLNIGLVEI